MYIIISGVFRVQSRTTQYSKKEVVALLTDLDWTIDTVAKGETLFFAAKSFETKQQMIDAKVALDKVMKRKKIVYRYEEINTEV